jgi:tyrosyl-tRNA synthetase
MQSNSQQPAEQAMSLLANVVDSLPDGALQERLSAARAEARPLRVKLGIDPTAPDIHLGHAVVLRKLREFQDHGHRVVLIVGDTTAQVGDPSGRSTLRPILSAEEIGRNAASFHEQALKILDPSSERLEIRRNGEWLQMALGELLALMRTTTVAQILERDDFAKRLAAGQPVSVLEMMYPLLQGYDSVAVRADVELGGTDQKFNLLLGRDIQRAYGQPGQAIVTMPILVGVDGKRKMSKSLGNHIGITDEPAEMYGKTMSIPDEAMEEYFRLLLSRETPTDLGPRDAKRLLAREIVTWLHGPQHAHHGRWGVSAPPGADRRGIWPLALGGAADVRARRRAAGRSAPGRQGTGRACRAAGWPGAAGRQAALLPPARSLSPRSVRRSRIISGASALRSACWRQTASRRDCRSMPSSAILPCRPAAALGRRASCRSSSEQPSGDGLAVFENSTACALAI